MEETEIITILVTSLMKLTQVNMTTKHTEIKEFMKKLEVSSNYFINKIASGNINTILEFICNAKYGKALSCSN